MIVHCRNCGHPINLDNELDIFNPNLICPNCGEPLMNGGNYCYRCGKPTFPEDIQCINCGAYLVKPAGSWEVTLALAFLLGWLGIHRFYTRHYLTGLLQLLTLGGLGIWVIIDIIRILLGDFKDGKGIPIKPLFRQKLQTIKNI